MRIERVDDTTVKLFITYSDIEARGFKREDLWTNRKRGEEFFWNMMEEINEEEDFVVEGPLWIQVHAFEKGVEVTISKSKNEDLINMSDEDNDQLDHQVNDLLSQTFDQDDSLEDLFEQRQQQKETQQDQERNKRKPQNTRTVIVRFNDLEEVIDYAYHNNQRTDEFEDLLYSLNNVYYYAVHFDETVGQETINDSYSQLLEFAYPTDKSEVYLNDYAKIIMSHNVASQVRRYFPDTTE
ncbi:MULTISPECIES: adaptor protein MecA [Staphylococcus]|uniref:Adapter protein MecA n=1 Tax=Staphylococcus ureilyticus TaxID=94138 RepID=A0AB34AFQ0_STAUR|nr:MULTISPECIES: adaptor protein MecA [Staphylococcus]AVL76347.1 adaptor protein MecA [Staphylococcus cohnii]KKD22848.1 competence negative regulator MecA [Staphylococcus cohnii subsp. cohnii]KKD24941.1 competence negative regulator MecA [Staphylococcus cohnii subsp. cohnii]MBL0375574.1 adaptor protein MecA [Staphylococcus sp. S75]MBL0384091.1 adaptor protein MecA [Staphylococcus sp. S59]